MTLVRTAPFSRRADLTVERFGRWRYIAGKWGALLGLILLYQFTPLKIGRIGLVRDQPVRCDLRPAVRPTQRLGEPGGLSRVSSQPAARTGGAERHLDGIFASRSSKPPGIRTF
jgi:hypothetical protein